MKSVIFALSALLLSGCVSSTRDIPAVEDFKPELYMGKWYEIARLPQWFERNLDYVTATYSQEENGSVKVVNSGIKQSKPQTALATARAKNPEQRPLSGELEVSFLRPFFSDYRIVELQLCRGHRCEAQRPVDTCPQTVNGQGAFAEYSGKTE